MPLVPALRHRGDARPGTDAGLGGIPEEMCQVYTGDTNSEENEAEKEEQQQQQ